MCSSALFRRYAIVNIQPCMKGSTANIKLPETPQKSYLHLVAIEWHEPGHLANPCQTAQDLPWQSLRHEITSMLASHCADCRILDVRNEKSATAEPAQNTSRAKQTLKNGSQVPWFGLFPALSFRMLLVD